MTYRNPGPLTIKDTHGYVYNNRVSQSENQTNQPNTQTKTSNQNFTLNFSN